tara:strand:+ start:791 stop:1240 length:450 start_codon:yes stop_codon:yes gene_type:complete
LTIRRTSNFKRRNRPNNRRSNFSKNGLDNSPKGRGPVSKILEKYLTMAYDANSNGDRIKAEGLFQHAEHYQRVINSIDNNNEEQKESSKNFSRTQRAIVEKNKRLEKNSQKNLNLSEENKNSGTKKINEKDATLDGVEALKAFTSIEDK